MSDHCVVYRFWLLVGTKRIGRRVQTIITWSDQVWIVRQIFTVVDDTDSYSRLIHYYYPSEQNEPLGTLLLKIKTWPRFIQTVVDMCLFFIKLKPFYVCLWNIGKFILCCNSLTFRVEHFFEVFSECWFCLA